jgi:SAM-dependent methyltransferase
VNIPTTSTFLSTDGDGYELQMGRWSRRLAPLLVDFADVSAADQVLDVGCGTGALSVCLAQRLSNARICGVDLSPVYVEHANSKNREPRIGFEIGDACALPFAGASFDHSLSMLALGFTPDPDLAVREMRRVTRPGGTVAAATWDTRGGFVAFRMIFDAAAILDAGGNLTRARAYTRPLSRPGDLARAWHGAGMVHVVQEMRTIRMDFADFEDFWTPAAGGEGPVAEFISSLDGALKSKLCDAVRSAYLDGETDGPRSYAATAWVVRGEVPQAGDC